MNELPTITIGDSEECPFCNKHIGHNENGACLNCGYTMSRIEDMLTLLMRTLNSEEKNGQNTSTR